MTGRGHVVAKENVSPKSYGTAVTLCGIFGIVGVHHFYIGNILHGLIDLGLFAATIMFYMTAVASNDGGLFALAALCFFTDVLHTIIVFFRLIVGKQKDGSGRLIAVPG